MTGSPRWGTIRAVLVTSSCVGHAETVSRLVAAVEAAGMTVFARIDHAAGAREVGLELAVELPLRMLVWAVGDDVLVGYDDPRELAGRYAVDEHHGTLEAMAKLLAELAIQAASTGA
jgi:uncharacterized protein (DUF302 family)